MELKNLDEECKRLKQRMYWRKRMDKIKADPEKYEEFKRKDRIRTKRYRDLKKMNKKEANMPKTIEELKKEIKRLKSKEASRKSYLKLKADPERYAKKLAYVRERYMKKKAEREEFLAAAHKAVEQINSNVEDIKPVDLSASIEEISMPNVDITPEPTLEEAYNNFRAKINKYFVDVTAEYSILNAFELYINAYKKYILSKVEELLNTKIGE